MDQLNVDREGTKAFYSPAPEDEMAGQRLRTLNSVQIQLRRKISVEEIKQRQEAA